MSDNDPADKIPAIEQAVRQHDTHVEPQLVAGLDSDDSAIRLYCIDALQRMTGQTLGYQFFLDHEQRAPAIDRWKQWLATQPRS